MKKEKIELTKIRKEYKSLNNLRNAEYQLKCANESIDDFLEHIVGLSNRLTNEIKSNQKFIKEIREGTHKTDATVLNYLEWSVNAVENAIRNVNFSKAISISESYNSAEKEVELLKKGRE